MTGDREEQMPTTPPPLLRAADVARILGVTPVRVRELVAEGRLRSVRLGEHGWHRFRVEDVERLIAGETAP
jgi:excisionase family DNA binding protein